MKLLVLLGAGSSCAQIAARGEDSNGFPLVGELNAEIAQWAKDFAAATDNIDYYGELLKLRSAYNETIPGMVESSVTFEQVLGDFYALLNGLREAPFGDTILAKAAEAMGFPNDYSRYSVAQEQIENLTTMLAARFRVSSRRFESAIEKTPHAEFSGYKELIKGLGKVFDLGIYNLNYDTVALNAASGPFTGFDEGGRFQPDEVHARGAWNFIYHLHGSVHYSFNDAPDDRIVWKRKLDDGFNDKRQILTEGADNRVRIASTVVAGGWKLDQLQDEPFQTFYSTFPRHAYEADAILIGGYGFGDKHINSVLTNVLLNPRKKIPIMLLEKSTINTCPKIGEIASPRTNSSPWTRAQNTLRLEGLGRPGPMRAIHHPEFEYLDDRRRPTAIWLNGFETACSKLDTVAKWLKEGSFG